jgi:predicted Zn-dependent peptidase
MGDQINAYTSEEFPPYEGRVLRQNLGDALALNLDMLLFSKFTPGPWKWSATP